MHRARATRHPSLVTEQRWRVIRQDDNGNVVVVAVFATEAEARARAADLEARGHKQLYTAEPQPEG
jgi:hypothetical protein